VSNGDKNKDLLYTLLGGALLLKDKFAPQFDEILKKAKEQKEDLRENIDQTLSKADEQKSQMENELRAMIKKIIDEMGLATKEDIEELKELIKSQKS
jgi:polyhydroxyalkanoate synthesis regulator phasin